MNKYMSFIAAAFAGAGLAGLLSGFLPDAAPPSNVWRGNITAGSSYRHVPIVKTSAQSTAMAGARFPLIQTLTPARETSVPHTGLLRFDADDSVKLATASGSYDIGRLEVREGPYASFDHTASPAPGFPAVHAREDALFALASYTPGTLKGDICMVSASSRKTSGSGAAKPLPVSAGKYQQFVERYADKYNLEVPLVLAIIKTESGFNPGLISNRNAHGLMQVVPASAGGEVHRWLGRKGRPTSSELLNPETNIRYGTAYLHLLKSKHLEGIRNPKSLEYCMIASYNGGSGAVLRHFGPDRKAAVAAINSMPPQEVLLELTENFFAAETRSFVRKVLDSRRQYTMLASHDAPASQEFRVINAPASGQSLPTLRPSSELASMGRGMS